MLQFRGSVVTSDAGLLAYREFDDALGLSTIASDALADARTGKNGRHAASPSQMDRFETRWLAAPENLRAFGDLSGQWIDRVRGCRSTEEIILDMDSSVSPTHGEQEQSVWNGHFGCTC
jgi:hypothetical protein